MTQKDKTSEPLITAEEYAKSLELEVQEKKKNDTAFNKLAENIVKFILVGTIIAASLLLWFMISWGSAF